MTANTNTVYLNGEFVAPDAAKVSVFDRGFIFGDGIYEYVPVFGRRMFRWPQHLARLEASLRDVRIPNPLSREQWLAIFERLIAANDAADQSIYIHITRGAAARDHGFPPHNPRPTVFAYAQPLKYPTPEQLARGEAAITASDIRWSRCDIKAIALLANALLRQQAIDAGAAEAILLRDGFMTEGAACNIFIVKDGCAVTPPKSNFILPGITRDLALELMRAHGIACAERPVPEAELRAADEIWLTSSGKEILPITQLDGKPVGSGKPGPVHARVSALYHNYKRAFCEGKVQ
jgi:D-alanine transaminase